MKNIFFFNFKCWNFFFFFNLKYLNFIFFFNFIVFYKFKFVLNKFLTFSQKKVFYLKKNYLFNYLNFYFISDNYISKKNFKYNYKNYKTLISIIYNMYSSNLNFLLYDYTYKYIYNSYLNMYGFKNILIYRFYFFMNPDYFAHKTLEYLYSNFLKLFKICFVIVFNYSEYVNYWNSLLKMDSIFFLINTNRRPRHYDYLIKLNLFFLRKYFLVLIINNVFLISLNFNFYKNKIIFLNYFSKF